MNSLPTQSLSAVELAAIIGGGDSFGKDAGQFIGGAVGTAVSLPWWASLLPASLVGAYIITGGIEASTN